MTQTTREPEEWDEIKLGKGVRLLLGWRTDDNSIEARPVKLSAATAKQFRKASAKALTSLAKREKRDYDSNSALDDGQYFSLPMAAPTAGDAEDTVESGQQHGGPFSEEQVAAAEIVALTRGAFERDDELSRDELSEGTWLFYLVVVEIEGTTGLIGFVRQFNPHRGFSTGRFPTIYAERLEPLDKPVLNFDFTFDAIIAPDELAVLAMTGFERVFSDLKVAQEEVAEQAKQTFDALTIALDAPSTSYLEEVCEAKPGHAKRLRRIAGAPHLSKISKRKFRDALARHGLPRDRFGNGKELKLESADDVAVFLDMLEERYYETDFSNAHRRADRFSARP